MASLPKRVTVKKAALDALQADAETRAKAKLEGVTFDSFVNFAHKMGVGADNALSTASYGFNPITRNRTLLEWIHRGSWLGGVAVDLIADDMTRGGVSIKGSMKPDQISKLEETAISYDVMGYMNKGLKWSRLYGGAIVVMMIDGQDFSKPLNLERVGKRQFQGTVVFDRWMVNPSLEELVTDPGPYIGQPKYYTVNPGSQALPGVKIHYSRVIRLIGVELPYWQQLTENLWGISVIERLYDRMIAFDSATTGASQLVYKSYLRTLSVKGLREVVAQGGKALEGLVSYVDIMRRYQGVEGISLIDGEDEFSAEAHSAFSGLDSTLSQLGQQLAGAFQIPLVRLFGQSPSGFSSGDTDLRMYYDSIKQQQIRQLGVGLTKIYRCMSASEGIPLEDDFKIEFNSLWQLTSKEMADIAQTVTSSIIQASDSGLITDKTALKELKQSSSITGIFSNITDEEIEQASDEPPPEPELDLSEEGGEDKPEQEEKPEEKVNNENKE